MKARTLFTACMAIAASSPPVRQVARQPATARQLMLASTQTSGLPWAAPKVIEETTVVTTSPTTGRRNQDPTTCMIQPRKKYSSAAAWNGTISTTMTSRATQCAGRGPPGPSTSSVIPT